MPNAVGSPRIAHAARTRAVLVRARAGEPMAALTGGSGDSPAPTDSSLPDDLTPPTVQARGTKARTSASRASRRTGASTREVAHHVGDQIDGAGVVEQRDRSVG